MVYHLHPPPVGRLNDLPHGLQAAIGLVQVGVAAEHSGKHDRVDAAPRQLAVEIGVERARRVKVRHRGGIVVEPVDVGVPRPFERREARVGKIDFRGRHARRGGELRAGGYEGNRLIARRRTVRHGGDVAVAVQLARLVSVNKPCSARNREVLAVVDDRLDAHRGDDPVAGELHVEVAAGHVQGNGYLADDPFGHAPLRHDGRAVRLHAEAVVASRVVSGGEGQEVASVRKGPETIGGRIAAAHGGIVRAGRMPDGDGPRPALKPAEAARGVVGRLAVHIVAPCARRAEGHEARRLETVAVNERPDRMQPVVVREHAFAQDHLRGRVPAPRVPDVVADLHRPSAATAARYAIRAKHRVHMPQAVVNRGVLVTWAVCVEPEDQAVDGEETRLDFPESVAEDAGLRLVFDGGLFYAFVSLAGKDLVGDIDPQPPAAVFRVPRDMPREGHLNRAVRAVRDFKPEIAIGLLAPAVPDARAVSKRRERRLHIGAGKIPDNGADGRQDRIPVAQDGEPAVPLRHLKRAESRASNRHDDRPDSAPDTFDAARHFLSLP